MKKISIHESFESLSQSWEQMHGEADSIFFHPAWFRNLSEAAFENNSALRIYCIDSASNSESAAPDCILPMCWHTSPQGLFALRKLTAMANFYTPLFSPLLSSSLPSAQKELNSLAHAIANEHPRWDVIDLHPMRIDTALFNDTFAAFHLAGMAVQRYFCFGNWYLEVKGRTYQEYFATLPSKLKNTLQRKSRQLEENHIRIKVVADGSDIDDCIDAYVNIYNASWKTAEPHSQFMPGLIRLCAQRGWLRIGIAYVDEQPAAAQIWIVHNGVASIFKLAYDQRFAKLSLGSMLTARLMQHVIDIDHAREVDYLMGDEPYKRDWMSSRRERWGIVAFNLRTAKGMFAACRHVGGQRVKRMVSKLMRRK